MRKLLIFLALALSARMAFAQSSGSGAPTSACAASNAGALYTDTSTAPVSVYTCSYYNMSYQWVVNPSYGGIEYLPTVPTTCSGALPIFLSGWPQTTLYVCVDGTPQTLQSGGGGTGTGTVTSVAQTAPSWLTVSGSPVTSSGTIALSAASGQAANEFLATPNGATGAVALRAIVAADIPTLNQNTTGNAATATALAAAPTQCGPGDYATGINTSGAANCAVLPAPVADVTLSIPAGTQAASSCSTPATLTMTGVTATMGIGVHYAAQPTGAGWSAPDVMQVQAWPSAANTVSYQICNNSTSSESYGAVSMVVTAR